jgi:hypothetical protein
MVKPHFSYKYHATMKKRGRRKFLGGAAKNEGKQKKKNLKTLPSLAKT